MKKLEQVILFTLITFMNWLSLSFVPLTWDPTKWPLFIIIAFILIELFAAEILFEIKNKLTNKKRKQCLKKEL